MVEFSKDLQTALRQRSEEIVPDLYEADPESASDAECVAESAIGGLIFLNDQKLGKQADIEINELARVHGYRELLKEAAKWVATY